MWKWISDTYPTAYQLVVYFTLTILSHSWLIEGCSELCMTLML